MSGKPAVSIGAIGINGFGRIGRMFLRQCRQQSLKVVAINDFSLNARYAAYLLKFDSSQGRFKKEISLDGNNLLIGEEKISLSFEADPKSIKWAEMGVNCVVDCSGKFTTLEAASAHLTDGVEKVIISAPSNDAPMFVVGVNLDKYELGTKVISCASCTTNCLAPLAKVVHEAFQIEQGLMTTVHAATASQRIVDSVTTGESWRDSRNGMANVIPMATDAAKVLGKVIPELDGKVTGMAFRVPISTVSVVDFTCRLGNPAKLDDIKARIKEASNGDMKGIITYVDDEVVSSDFIGSKCATAFDARASMGLSDDFIKLIAWYDNESGYSTQLARLVKHCLAVEQEAKEEKERQEQEAKLEEELKAKVLEMCRAKLKEQEAEKNEKEQGEECADQEPNEQEESEKKKNEQEDCADQEPNEQEESEKKKNEQEEECASSEPKEQKDADAEVKTNEKDLAEEQKKLEQCVEEMMKVEKEKLAKQKEEEAKAPCHSPEDASKLAESADILTEKIEQMTAKREENQNQLEECCEELAKKEKEQQEKEEQKEREKCEKENAKQEEEEKNVAKSESKSDESSPDEGKQMKAQDSAEEKTEIKMVEKEAKQPKKETELSAAPEKNEKQTCNEEKIKDPDAAKEKNEIKMVEKEAKQPKKETELSTAQEKNENKDPNAAKEKNEIKMVEKEQPKKETELSAKEEKNGKEICSEEKTKDPCAKTDGDKKDK